jgi:hypothetical protein
MSRPPAPRPDRWADAPVGVSRSAAGTGNRNERAQPPAPEQSVPERQPASPENGSGVGWGVGLAKAPAAVAAPVAHQGPAQLWHGAGVDEVSAPVPDHPPAPTIARPPPVPLCYQPRPFFHAQRAGRQGAGPEVFRPGRDLQPRFGVIEKMLGPRTRQRPYELLDGSIDHSGEPEQGGLGQGCATTREFRRDAQCLEGGLIRQSARIGPHICMWIMMDLHAEHLRATTPRPECPVRGRCCCAGLPATQGC